MKTIRQRCATHAASPLALALGCALCGTACAGPFPAVFDLASLQPEHGGDGRAGFVLTSAMSGQPGESVAAALVADFDGDGIDDFVLGAPDLHNPQAIGGAAFVVFGRRQPRARIDLDALDGSDGFRIDPGSLAPGHRIVGVAVAAAGDVNGDGANDLLVASDRSVFALFGHSDGAATFPARLDLGALDGADGVRIDLGATPSSLAAAGDLDGDGIGDLIASDEQWRAGSAMPTVGALYALFGRNAFPPVLDVADLDGSNGFRITGDGAHFRFGRGGVSARRDLDGDGRADLVAADDRRGLALFGTAPPFPESRELPAPDGDRGFAFIAGSAPDFAVADAGDLNDDGWPDLVFSERERSYPGPWTPGRSVFVVFGHAGPYPATLDAGDLDGGAGFRYLAEPDAHLAGAYATGIGDLDGDGIDDLAVFSTRCCSAPALADRSVVHVVFGRREGFPAQMDESILDGERGFLIDASADAGAAGVVVGGGDLDGDGIDDLVVALNHREGSPPYRPGDFAYVVYGREASLFADGFVDPP